MIRNQDGWISQYKQKGALWIHDGNPNRPHALLTSGKHSNGFFNSRLVIPDEVLLREAASDLLELFNLEGGDISKVPGVVGPKTGATKLAEFISEEIDGYYECFSVSPAKSETDGKKSMVFTVEERYLLRSNYVLLCDDVLTTGVSVDRTIDAVINAGAAVLPFLLLLVNRSGLLEISGREIIALIDHPMPMWDVDCGEECPLCKQGSEAIRPKNPPEWARLNAEY